MDAGAVNAIVACKFPGVPTPIIGAPGVPPTTPKLCVTVGAAKKEPLPAWFALMVQVPNPTIVAFVPDTVQTDSVIDVNVTGFPLAPPVATNGIGVELKVCEPGLAKVIDWLARPPTVKLKFCVTLVPLLAVKTNGKVPVEEGVPEISNWPALGVNVKPDGGVPEVRLIVGAGLPVAITVKLFEEPVENVVAAALVNAGAGLRLRVKLAVSADSVGTVVAPQEPSASTAAVETLFRLIT